MPSESSRGEIAKSHRWHAVECNNLAWSLSELSNRTPEQGHEMLNAAHSAAFHWAKVGTDLNDARAKMLLGRVHAALGNGSLAMRYARESYDYLVKHDAPDWELAFAHAILADAASACRDAAIHRDHYLKAKEIGATLSDPEDAEIFRRTFDLIPRP
jgi:hypothetical protein